VGKACARLQVCAKATESSSSIASKKPGGTLTTALGATGLAIAPGVEHMPGLQPAEAQPRTSPYAAGVAWGAQGTGSPAVVRLNARPPPVSAKAAIRLLKVAATK